MNRNLAAQQETAAKPQGVDRSAWRLSSRTRLLAGLCIALALVHTLPASHTQGILGNPPSYTRKNLSDVPNAAAIGRRIWAPGLDEGFVPQGLTMADEKLLLVFYRSTKMKPEGGLSRVFQIDPATGDVTGQFDLPGDVVHPGGLAYGEGALFVADGGKLLRLDLRQSLATGHAVLTGRRALDHKLGPSFLAYHAGALWFGSFLRATADEPRLYAVPVSKVFAKDAESPLKSVDATHHIPMPILVQGATFDTQGRLWLSASVQREGWLYRLSPETGNVLARYAMPPGIEDLAHAGDVLWSVSECGSKRWLASPTFYPLLFEIYPGRLVADRP